MEAHVVYRLPPGQRPRQFRKSEPTDTELARLVAQSPLRFHIERPADKADHRPRPPMSPGIGHRAMLLASGHIDGLICPAGRTAARHPGHGRQGQVRRLLRRRDEDDRRQRHHPHGRFPSGRGW